MTSVGFLWSGGWDSTALLLRYLTEHKEPVQPIYIAHRGGGKCGREWRIITKELYPMIKYHYPHLQEPIRHYFPMIKKEKQYRNARMIWFVKYRYPEFTKIGLGIYSTASRGNYAAADVDVNKLAMAFNIPLITMDYYHWNNKKEALQFFCQPEQEAAFTYLRHTWSCQMWWKQPCGKCYSCKERKEMYQEIFYKW